MLESLGKSPVNTVVADMVIMSTFRKPLRPVRLPTRVKWYMIVNVMMKAPFNYVILQMFMIQGKNLAFT